MARNLDPKCKRCRRLGEKLYLKGERCFTPKCPMVKRNYPPGLHGPKQVARRLTGYAAQLREKQKAKEIYGILENQFKNYVLKAMKKSGDSGENLLRLLELRLDNVVYRLGLAASRDLARQLVLHKHFSVNNKTVNIPSYQVKPGDIITIREKYKKLFSKLEKSSQKQEIPSWLGIDQKILRGEVLGYPPFEEMKQALNVPEIIEFYSR